MKKRHLHDRRRFIAPQGRRGDGHGYLDQPDRDLIGTSFHVDEPSAVERIASATAMCDEPEALSHADWVAHIDKRAKDSAEQQRRFEDAQREQARRMMSFEERLRAVVAEAKKARNRVDVSRDLRLLRQMQMAGKSVRHLEQRLFALERKVWSRPDAEAA